MPEENWLTVTDPDFTHYEVSDLGRVRNKKTGVILQGHIQETTGLRKVSLHASETHNVFSVAALVYAAFVGPIGHRIPGYKDGNKRNLALSNLFLKDGPDNPGSRAMHEAHVSALQATSAKEAWDMVFAEQFPETMKFVERMRKNRPDHDALWLSLGAALAPFSRAELGLEEEQGVAA